MWLAGSSHLTPSGERLTPNKGIAFGVVLKVHVNAPHLSQLFIHAIFPNVHQESPEIKILKFSEAQTSNSPDIS